MSKEQPLPKLRFADFVLDVHARALYRRHIRLKLHRQPLEILVLLLSRPEEVIAREELITKLWPSTFVDGEHGLNTAIKKLRQTLGDSVEQPRFIQTVPRIGYRFIGQIQTDGSEVRAAGLSSTTAGDSTRQSAASGGFLAVLARRKWLIAVAAWVALIAVGGAGFLRFRSWARAGSKPGATRTMLAVAPFRNLTGDPGQDYLSDGLTEEMITQLGRAAPERFGIIAPTSVMQYRNSDGQFGEIGRRLGVEYILQAGVRRDSQRVRITAQLIRVRDEKVLWARQYDRELTSLLALQGEIAQEIADEVQLTLGDGGASAAAGGTKSATSAVPYEAYDLYLKGRYFLNERSTQSFPRAIEYFQEAVAKDPNYASAFAGLADSYALASSYNLSPPEELLPKARAAALKALQFDNSLAEAHTSLALIAENFDWDWQTADKEFRLAIQLDGNYPTAHEWYGECLAWQGRFDEAYAESERARELDPLSLIVATDHAAISYYSRRYDRAIEELRTIIEIEPHSARAHGLLILAYVQERKFAAALADIEKWRRTENSPAIWAVQAYVYGRSGRLKEARQSLVKFERLNEHKHMDPKWLLSLAYMGIGDKEQFFACLQKALLERSNSLTGLKVDPIYDAVRNDPRFQKLERRVGLVK